MTIGQNIVICCIYMHNHGVIVHMPTESNSCVGQNRGQDYRDGFDAYGPLVDNPT